MLEAAGGLIDFTHVGDDLGNQRGPMIGMPIFEKHFVPKYGKYFAMVHAHGAKTHDAYVRLRRGGFCRG